METVLDLRASATLLSSVACYERYADMIGRDITSSDVAEVIMTSVRCKVYPRDFLIHVRKCIEFDNVLPSYDLEVNAGGFNPELHIIVTCATSHVNHSLGHDLTLCGASVRGRTHGKCVVWW